MLHSTRQVLRTLQGHKNHRPPLVAPADELEERIGTVAIDGQVSDATTSPESPSSELARQRSRSASCIPSRRRNAPISSPLRALASLRSRSLLRAARSLGHWPAPVLVDDEDLLLPLIDPRLLASRFQRESVAWCTPTSCANEHALLAPGPDGVPPSANGILLNISICTDSYRPAMRRAWPCGPTRSTQAVSSLTPGATERICFTLYATSRTNSLRQTPITIKPVACAAAASSWS